MKLFDPIENRDEEPMPRGESKFRYLNRSGRPEFEKMRCLLEEWFSHYPSHEKKELHRRFHSSKGSGFFSPFFELFLYALHRKMGCKITIHPKLNNETDKRPDFLIEAPDDKSYYLEAVAESGESAEDTSSNSRKSEIIDAINRRLKSPNFWLEFQVIKETKSAPPAKAMTNFLEERLVNLNPDEIARQFEQRGLASLPEWEFNYQGWIIKFSPIPKSPKARGKTGRPIGMIFDGADWAEIHTRIPLLDALKKKAGKYKNLDLPYVIAVNAYSDFLDDIDISEALIGQETYIANSIVPGLKFRRKPNGLWTSSSGQIYTRVSAVLFGTPVIPVNLVNAPIRLYHNPWAKIPYSSVLNRLPQSVLEGNDFVKKEGKQIGNLLDLPANWPK